MRATTLIDPFRRSWFRLAVIFLITFFVINFSGGAFLSSLMNIGWVQRLANPNNPLIDEERWTRWLVANAALFTALEPGAKIGILKALTEQWGAVWVKQDGWMVFQISGDVKAEDPGAILCFSEETAEVLLSTAEQESADVALQAVRRYIRAGEMKAYYLKTPQTLQAGFPEFLRHIGAWNGGPPFEIDEDPLPTGYLQLDPQGWTVTASHSSAGTSPNAVIDGAQEMGWQSGESMSAGMFLKVDFGRKMTVVGVELLNPWENRRDYPRGLEVAVSQDGTHWSVVAQATWSGEDTPGDGDVWVAFAPVQSWFLRLRQTENREQDGSLIIWWWSVGELRIYTSEDTP